MATFLFWNMGKKPLQESLFRLVMRHKVDVLMLAEAGQTAGRVLESLNRDESLYSAMVTPQPDREKVRIFARSARSLLRHEENHFKFRWTMSQLKFPGLASVLLVAVHLNSKSVYTEQSQITECLELANHIRRVEERIGHRRTLVVGDFNRSPFEVGVFGLKHLNAEPTRLMAQSRVRLEDGQKFPYFYNPMWNLFGDATRGPAGTYFFQNYQSTRIAWNMFDQVLLRPELLPFFSVDSLKILDGDGVDSFLTRDTKIPRGRPKNPWSDHLPILFDLNL